MLERAGIEFSCVVPGPEPRGEGDPAACARQRARSKAEGASLPPRLDAPVLGVDTVVEIDGIELGKPKDRAAAAATLARLSGRVHLVHSAHCLFDPRTNRRLERVATAEVRCAPLGAETLRRYLDSGQWKGKAGAYGIQDPEQDFMELVCGDLDTVIGLHVPSVVRLLAELRLGPSRS